MREIASNALSRAAGAPLIEGNKVTLLKDAQQNYPAWLTAIQNAAHHIYFECNIFCEDQAGWMFADALIAKAREGIRVRLIYDWIGCFGKASSRYWNRLRENGVEVRCYNPPSLSSPLGWLSRDHRKMISTDGRIGFITGLCVGIKWLGMSDQGLEPWRDTGIEVCGPAVTEIERAFAQIWEMTGDPIPEEELNHLNKVAPCGQTALRVVASVPATAGMFRLDQLIGALARKRLWLTDAYYAGTTSYVQALRSAAKDGVDVRLLVPNASDIPVLRPLSRSGYRPLLEAGVRVYEWNGAMLHAKTAVADGRWARVGSTNLNIASWFGNCELDAVIENEAFADHMEKMYLDDLENATEVVLDAKHRIRAPGKPQQGFRFAKGSGSTGRAAAGVVRIGNTVGAAFTNRRILEPIESRIMLTTGLLLLGIAVLFALFPWLFIYPVVLFFVWVSIGLIYKSYKLRSQNRHKTIRLSPPQTQKVDTA